MNKSSELDNELVFEKEPSQSSGIYHNSDYNKWLDDNIQSDDIEKIESYKGDHKKGYNDLNIWDQRVT